ncbi:VOC family protein [Arthrobacter zhaoguopingii]|uniref:VOC family protein n=1 Tax=Arthrobacter zhaoguopingii TaxID=2681491 RepID=UPI00135CA9CE|nr:VOC family protein [Arthrobacter zhaoguopingii]
MEFKLEVVAVPVTDVDRAKAFYNSLGWRFDADFTVDEDLRVVQFTPPGSGASIMIGKGITAGAPGSLQGLYLIVDDIIAAREDIAARGIEISEVWHDAKGIWHHEGGKDRVAGPDPERKTYASYASFTDPDGNGWFLQEITTRLPGRS